MNIKPYSQVVIEECGEKLVPIPESSFTFVRPHPYIMAGAGPYYGQLTPYMLRTGILQALHKAQQFLQSQHKGWNIMVFDAYRPFTVQSYMVEREFRELARADGLNPDALTAPQREALAPRVYRLWAIPSDNPATPPPHSTGAALDCTLSDETGAMVFMGSDLDENSERSNPDYFAAAADEASRQAHANRTLLNNVMTEAGFIRHETEWWHFSQGDQLWAWRKMQKDPALKLKARYGGVFIRPDGLPELRG